MQNGGINPILWENKVSVLNKNGLADPPEFVTSQLAWKSILVWVATSLKQKTPRPFTQIIYTGTVVISLAENLDNLIQPEIQ